MMLLKCCTQYASKVRNSAMATGLEKVSVHLIPKKGNAKECSNFCTIVLISHTSKILLKSFKIGFSSIWTENFQMRKLGFKEAEEAEIKLPTFVGSQRKQRSFKKTSTSASLTTLMPLTVWITTNCGKFLKRWEYQTALPASWETCMQVRKQQLELDMEQQTGSKFEKE